MSTTEWPKTISVVRNADGSMFILQGPWCPTAGSEIATYDLAAMKIEAITATTVKAETIKADTIRAEARLDR